MTITPTTFTGIYKISDKKKQYYATRNLTPGIIVSRERTVYIDNTEYRLLDPRMSKLAAALHNGLQQLPIKPTDTMLYLGASTGTTTSYFSDMLGKTGFIFAVEIARRMCMDLVKLAEKRTNIAPILADAAQPEQYADNITTIDVIYQDISQRNQTNIFLTNCEKFLNKQGTAILCLKARSINVLKKPAEIYEQELKKIKQYLTIIDKRTLDPYQKDHLFIVCKKQ